VAGEWMGRGIFFMGKGRGEGGSGGGEMKPFNDCPQSSKIFRKFLIIFFLSQPWFDLPRIIL
jgi:hypothetical protein